MNKLSKLLLITIVSLTCYAKPAPVIDPTNPSAKFIADNTFKNGAVVTEDPYASKIGADILKQGGNAVDAAVAISYALAVTYPSAGNLGGGCFILIRWPDSSAVAINAREKAPALSTENMYIKKDGSVDQQKKLIGSLAVGVPGTVAGTLYALEKYGSKARYEVMSPAINLAENGFRLNIDMNSPVLTYFPSTKKIFLKPNGSFYRKGDRFVQKDLAKTLRLIAEKGPDGFYKGAIAGLISNTMHKYGGIITQNDLARYNVTQLKPVSGFYRGYQVVSMPPPSSGGIALIELLNLLEGFDLRSSGYNTPQTIHLMVEAEKIAFADRNEFIADPDFAFVPAKALTSKKYANERAKNISLDQATPSSQITSSSSYIKAYESDQTTHFCVVDKYGLAVAVTTTLNGSFGCGLTVDGAGFLLNNEMDDFSAKPGTPNSEGLIYGKANAVAPNKRPLSSMTPTIVSKDGKLFMITGAMGGPTIITSVAQTIINVIDHQMPAAKAVAVKRFHNQWLPDAIHPDIFYPDVFSDETKQELIARGYQFGIPKGGKVQAIVIDPNTGSLACGPDPRAFGSFAAGY